MQSINLLSFLTGTWRAADTYELQFTAAKAGSILGTMREFHAGKTRYFEFFQFTETDSGLVFHPYAMGRHIGACPCTSLEAEGRRIVFANPAQPEHRRIWFERDPSGKTVRMGTSGTKDGRTHELDWTFDRDFSGGTLALHC